MSAIGKQSAVPWPYLMRASEKQSGLDRVRFAELLILQLPKGHNGRDTWLLNFGVGEESIALRKEMGVPFIKEVNACPTSEAWSFT